MMLRALAVLCLLGAGVQPGRAGSCDQHETFVLLVHGGAGAGSLPLEEQRARRAVLRDVLEDGREIVRALDALRGAGRLGRDAEGRYCLKETDG